MKNSIFFIPFIFLLCSFQQLSFAQESIDSIQIKNYIWPNKSPQILPPGRKVWPLFGVKKMGATRNIEWRIEPLFFFVSPNLGLKKFWNQNKKGLQFSSVHQINYPSIYLNLIAREGSGGVLPKDSQIPPMLSIKNEFLLGYTSQGHFLTLKGGIVTTFKLSGAEKNFPDIDFPFLYNRTLSLNNTPNIYMGLNYSKDIRPRWNLEADFVAFKVDFESNDFVFDNQLVLFWKKSERFGLKVGAAAAYGIYPYGFDFRMIPVFDVLFGFGGNKKR